ncbi:putative hexokinase Kxk [Sporormia fimetaria CBS 119925]|uniref:Phosphotransferase n=1 Tax=Sporormia fimetaria CBS 119925 TaxID=1340428 RepID=A0A6A6VCI2_9PLEO|nr:putative hexokinase Kxk [Sporormia fimetaria CBS 119925]
MVGLGAKALPLRSGQTGSTAHCGGQLKDELNKLEELFTVSTGTLKKISNHFVKELEKGLSVEGGNIPMNPTWCMAFPDGHETGTFIALDMGGTNLRVCQITLTEEKGRFEITQSKYRMPEDLKTGTADQLWNYIADCLQQFIADNHEEDQLSHIPVGFTFSYPATQDYIDHGVLQRWTKGFDIDGVEGKDVVPPFEAALAARGLRLKLTALVNDTTGTLIASAYTDTEVKIGCIFGTGCNAAYMENVGSIPKLAHMNLDPSLPMAINCEWGAFDNEHLVLPRTKYDIHIDETSPRPGQQSYEKMVAGYYLGEIMRLVLLDLHDNSKCGIFKDQDISELKKPYLLDAGFISRIEEDPFENLEETKSLFQDTLHITLTRAELEFVRRLAELIGTRAARLTACGIAAICNKKGWKTCHVGADGSLFTKSRYFKKRQAKALGEILDWGEGKGDAVDDPVMVLPAEDGSGVGAALIAALTIKRVKQGQVAGIRDAESMVKALGI